MGDSLLTESSKPDEFTHEEKMRLIQFVKNHKRLHPGSLAPRKEKLKLWTQLSEDLDKTGTRLNIALFYRKKCICC